MTAWMFAIWAVVASDVAVCARGGAAFCHGLEQQWVRPLGADDEARRLAHAAARVLAASRLPEVVACRQAEAACAPVARALDGLFRADDRALERSPERAVAHALAAAIVEDATSDRRRADAATK